MRKNLISSVTLGAAVAATATLASGANITDLDPSTAIVDWNSGDATGVPVSGTSINRVNGFTFNIVLTPAADDLTGTTVIAEYGGTSNGNTLVLVDGVLTHTQKHNSADQFAPDSLNDLALRPNGTTRGEIAVQSAFGPLSAGTTYSVAVSWDQAGNLQLGVQGDTSGAADNFVISGEVGNWQGNNTLGVGVLFNSAGGLGGELAGVTVPNPWDVDETPVSAFAGTISDLHFWNAAGKITVIPEPASAALLGLGGLTLLRRRRA